MFGARTKLIKVRIESELLVGLELDITLVISDKEESMSEILLSSILQEADPNDPERDRISPSNFNFCDGLIRVPIKLNIDIIGASEGTIRTRADALASRLSRDDLIVMVTS